MTTSAQKGKRISVRVPADVFQMIKDRADRDRATRSAALVAMIREADAVNPHQSKLL